MALYHIHTVKNKNPVDIMKQVKEPWEEHRDFIILEAENNKDVFKVFANLFPESLLGGKTLVSKPFRIDNNKPITKLPFCELFYKGHIEGKFCCGPSKLFLDYDEGVRGMCTLHTMERPTGGYCPFEKMLPINHSEFPGKIKNRKTEKIVVDNIVYKVINLSNLKA